LEAQDIDEVGYTLRTASLMTDPEYYFDQSNPSDYILFGIRYLVLPVAMKPPIAAVTVLSRGNFRLWEVPDNSYFSVLETDGVVAENRSDIATQSLDVLRTPMISHHEDFTVRYGGSSLPPDLRPHQSASLVVNHPGVVLSSPGHASHCVHLLWFQ
jgi:hypothetical protein